MAIVRETFLIGGATILAQFVALCFQPILKQLFTPEEFGQLHLYITGANFVSVFFTYKLEYFLYQIKQQRLFFKISHSVIALAVIQLIVYVLLVLLIKIIVLRGPSSALEELAVPILVGGCITAIYRASILHASIQKDYITIGKARIYRRCTEGFGQTLLHSIGIYGLIIGEMFGNFIFTLKVHTLKGRTHHRYYHWRKKFKYFRFFAARNTKPALQKSISDLVDVWSEAVLTVMITIYGNFVILGYFELASRMLIGPLALVSASVAPIIVGTARQHIHFNRRRYTEYLTLILILIICVALFSSFYMLYMPDFIELLFGSNWLPTLRYMDLIIYYILLQFIVAPFGELLVIYGYVIYDSIWKVLRGLCLTSILLPFEISFDERIELFCVINFAIYLIYAVLIIYAVVIKK